MDTVLKNITPNLAGMILPVLTTGIVIGYTIVVAIGIKKMKTEQKLIQTQKANWKGLGG